MFLVRHDLMSGYISENDGAANLYLVCSITQFCCQI